jgi:glutamyl-tRNA reductase
MIRQYAEQRRKKNMKLSVTLDEKTSKAFEEVKKHMGVHTNRSVVGLMISHEEDRILRASRRKVFLPNEIYDKAERAAKTLNLTIHEYIDSVTEQLLKQPPEGLKGA